MNYLHNGIHITKIYDHTHLIYIMDNNTIGIEDHGHQQIQPCITNKKSNLGKGAQYISI
jgi:hypothetical protein